MPIAATAAAIAAASPPLPKTGKAYADLHGHSVHLTLIVNATNPRIIQPGVAGVLSEFAQRGGAVNCPSLKTSSFKPYAVFGFPRTTFRLSRGKYSFFVRVTVRAHIIGATQKVATMKLQVTGTAVSRALIQGTVRVSGGPCAIAGSVTYQARLSNLVVAPGQ